MPVAGHFPNQSSFALIYATIVYGILLLRSSFQQTFERIPIDPKIPSVSRDLEVFDSAHLVLVRSNTIFLDNKAQESYF